MKRIIAVLVILAILAGGAFFMFKGHKKHDMSRFSSEQVQKGTVQAVVTATGTLAAVTTVKVGSEVSGTIKKIFVEYNSEVKKGQVLAQIDPKTLQTQVDRAKSSLEKSVSSYENALANSKNIEASVRKAQADLDARIASAKQAASEAESSRLGCENSKASVAAARASLDKAAAEYANSKVNYERLKSLFEQDLIARSECDNAYTSMISSEAGLNSAKANLEGSLASLKSSESKYNSALINLDGVNANVQSARIQIEAAMRQLEASQASVKGAAADVEQAKASLHSAEVDLSKAKIVSPIDGIVLDILVSEGQTVAAQYQAPELFKLAQNLNEMQVEATIDEADIGQIKVGNQAVFTVDAWQDKEFSGTVREVRKSASTSNNVVTFPVIIDTTNPDMCLMPGMTATVDIHTVKHEDVLMVPSAALRFKPDESTEIIDRAKADKNKEADDGRKTFENKNEILGANERYVYIEDPNNRNKLIKVKVVTGLADGNKTEVSSEYLSENDKVITGRVDFKAAAAGARKKNNRRRGPF